MEQTLKVTNVMSDPTRFNIYQYLIETHKVVSVNDIAKVFDIHPNVARLHLSKLEEVNLITSFLKKTGKGGRPGRRYNLSNHVVELNFPARDYKILSSIALESLMGLGETGKTALFQTGKKYGKEAMDHYSLNYKKQATIDEKIKMLDNASRLLGMYAQFQYDEESKSIFLSVQNCPFKELADANHEVVCEMHHLFLKGMFEAIFLNVELKEERNIFKDNCSNCAYIAKLANN